MRKYLLPMLLALLPLNLVSMPAANAEQPPSSTQTDPTPILEKLHRTGDSTAEMQVTDMDGYLVRAPNDTKVYLVLGGFRRHIPDAATFTKLFKSSCMVWDSPFAGLIDLGAPLVGASLLRGDPSGRLYFFVDGRKEYIPNMTILNRYCFDASKSYTIPDPIIDYIPSGPDLD